MCVSACVYVCIQVIVINIRLTLLLRLAVVVYVSSINIDNESIYIQISYVLLINKYYA